VAERRATLMQPKVEQLLHAVDSKFTLVTLSSMRAREINDYWNQLGQGLGRIVPPQVTSSSRKPLSIALEEIEAGKIIGEAVEETDEETADGAEGDEVDLPGAEAGLSPDPTA
jgi:DNA-directed RNA polymerase subunit omega